MTIRILVADDHKLFRQGLISLMLTHDDLVEVVGEAATGNEAVQMAARLQPDVVLMDIYMPDGDGLQATREICSRFPKIAVVMLTSSEADEHLYEAVRLGASGYLLKSLDAEELFSLITGVMRGEAAMTRVMAVDLAVHNIRVNVIAPGPIDVARSRKPVRGLRATRRATRLAR